MSQCTIRQFPISHVLRMHNQVCSYHVPNVHSPLSPMWNTYMSLKHPANHPPPVLSPSLSNTSMKLGALARHLRKRQKKFATCPCTKIEYIHQHPEYFSCSSAVPSPLVVTQVTQCKGCKLRNSCRCVHASTLTIIK